MTEIEIEPEINEIDHLDFHATCDPLPIYGPCSNRGYLVHAVPKHGCKADGWFGFLCRERHQQGPHYCRWCEGTPTMIQYEEVAP